MENTSDKTKVDLFVTCLVDFFRPSVGFAAVKLLERAGCSVQVPERQTCCGQPAYNAGDRESARLVAEGVLETFEGTSPVIVPSGSCATMIKREYARLFADSPQLLERATKLGQRTHELISYLVDQRGLPRVEGRCNKKIAYHDGCMGLRNLQVKDQPRKLLQSLPGTQICELPNKEICCGFGGSFSVSYADVSLDMVKAKCEDVRASGAEVLASGDMGCLLNISGRLKREGSNVEVRHVAEILADMIDDPGIGDGSR
jgi:L-lactate dehydrogenase complex protein LldE